MVINGIAFSSGSSCRGVGQDSMMLPGCYKRTLTRRYHMPNGNKLQDSDDDNTNIDVLTGVDLGMCAGMG